MNQSETVCLIASTLHQVCKKIATSAKLTLQGCHPFLKIALLSRHDYRFLDPLLQGGLHRKGFMLEFLGTTLAPVTPTRSFGDMLSAIAGLIICMAY